MLGAEDFYQLGEGSRKSPLSIMSIAARSIPRGLQIMNPAQPQSENPQYNPTAVLVVQYLSTRAIVPSIPKLDFSQFGELTGSL